MHKYVSPTGMLMSKVTYSILDFVSYRDCTGINIMMDATDMYSNGFHPRRTCADPIVIKTTAKYYQRTKRPPNTLQPTLEYFVDMEPMVNILSNYRTKVLINLSQNFKVMGCSFPVKPFLTDVYYIGNVIRTDFMNVRFYPSEIRL